MTVSIRYANPQDRETCVEFIETLNGGPELSSWHETFNALVTRERGAVYVAGDDQLRLLGVATVSFNLAVRFGGEYCQLEELYVDPKARGQNCGGLLVQAVIDGARSRGCAEVGLYITPRHAANQSFYERFGFKDAGVEVRQKLQL